MRSKKALLNIVSNIMLELIVVINGIIVPKLIISTFGSDVNGLISSITQFLTYITLLESGFGPVIKVALFKPIAQKNKEEIKSILLTSKKIFRKIAYIFIAYLIILIFIYPLFVNSSYNFGFTVSLILILSISSFAEYFIGMTYKLFLQADQKTYVLSLIQILSYILNIVFVFILIKMNCSIQIVKLFSCLVFVIRPIYISIYVRKKYGLKIDTNTKEYNLKNKWDGLAQHIAAVVHTNTDITILTFFSNLSEISVYSVYFLIVKGIKQFIQSFANGIDSSFGNMIAKSEQKNLNEKFKSYEVSYLTIVTIFFTTTLILITPFVSIYMKNVTDANYVRYTFGYLMVVSEFIWAIRQPYNNLIKVAGHFKETRVGAWVECFCNLIISLIFVHKFGLIGVAIGTIFAMFIRTCEFVYHVNKYILKRSLKDNILIILLSSIEMVIVWYLYNNFISISYNNYLTWIIYAIIIFSIITIFVLIINSIFYFKEYKKMFIILKNAIVKKENRAK